MFADEPLTNDWTLIWLSNKLGRKKAILEIGWGSTFYVEKFESSNCRYTLQSLYTALDHQLQDGLMAQHEFDRMRYIIRKLFDLKLQIHVIEAVPSLPLPPADVIRHTVAPILDLYYTSKVVIRLCVYSFVVSCKGPFSILETRGRKNLPAETRQIL